MDNPICGWPWQWQDIFVNMDYTLAGSMTVSLDTAGDGILLISRGVVKLVGRVPHGPTHFMVYLDRERQPSIPRAVARPMTWGNQFIIYMSWSFVSPKDERQALRMSTVAAKLHILSSVPGLAITTGINLKRDHFVGDIARFGSGLSQPIRVMP